jgi:hypothetical protein
MCGIVESSLKGLRSILMEGCGWVSRLRLAGIAVLDGGHRRACAVAVKCSGGVDADHARQVGIAHTR